MSFPGYLDKSNLLFFIWPNGMNQTGQILDRRYKANLILVY